MKPANDVMRRYCKLEAAVHAARRWKKRALAAETKRGNGNNVSVDVLEELAEQWVKYSKDHELLAGACVEHGNAKVNRGEAFGYSHCAYLLRQIVRNHATAA